MLCKISFLVVATLLVTSEALTPEKRGFGFNANLGSMSAGFSMGSKAAANSSSSATSSTSSAASQAANLSSSAASNSSNCFGSNPLLAEKAKAAIAVLASQVSKVSAIFGQGRESARAQGAGAEGIAQYFEMLQNSTNDVIDHLRNISSVGSGSGNGNATSNSTAGSGSAGGSGSNPITGIIQGLEKAGGLLMSIVKLALDIKKQIISGALEAAGEAAGAIGPQASAGLQSLAKLVSAGNDSVGGGFGQNGLANAPLAGLAAAGASLAGKLAGTAGGMAQGFGIAV